MIGKRHFKQINYFSRYLINHLKFSGPTSTPFDFTLLDVRTVPAKCMRIPVGKNHSETLYFEELKPPYATPISPNPWKYAALVPLRMGVLHYTTGWIPTPISTELFTKLVISILMTQKLTCPTPCKTELKAFFFPSPTSLA